MKTAVLQKYIDGEGNNVIEMDSWREYVIDAIKEGIQLVKNFNADLGKIELSGQKLVLFPDDDYEEVFNKYLAEWN